MKECRECKVQKNIEEFYLTNNGVSRQTKCKQCCREYQKIRVNAPGYVKKKQITKEWKELSEATKKRSVEYTKQWRKDNPERSNANLRSWKKKNRSKVLAYKKSARERDKLDPLKVMKRRLRNRTVKAFKVTRWSKTSKNITMLGCSWEEAFKHIESGFTKGMSWGNRSEWHIDHIIPLASATTEEELISLFHYTNLQPLWAKDNLKKSFKY